MAQSEASDERVGRMEFLLNLRRRGITDAAVLRAMDEVPREYFVTADCVGAAYEDQALPIACGQTISQPYVIAFMTERLRLAPQHRVLEIGTGTGYQTAILSRIAHEVVSVERYRTLADTAKVRLQTLGVGNAEIIIGDGLLGVPERAPFDRILVTAAAEEVPQALVNQLANDGVLIMPVGPEGGRQGLARIVRTHEGIAREDLMPVRFVPLLPGRAREM